MFGPGFLSIVKQNMDPIFSLESFETNTEYYWLVKISESEHFKEREHAIIHRDDLQELFERNVQ